MSKENTLNVEVGDSIVLKDIIFNDKGILVSKDFQDNVGRPMEVKSVENGMITVQGFDEQFPLDWVKEISWKHYSEEELARKELLENKINSFKSIPCEIACFVDKHFGWALGAWAIGILLLAILVASDNDIISFIGLISMISLSALTFLILPAISFILYYGIYRKQKKQFDILLKNNFNVTVAEASRFHLQMSDVAFTREEWDEYFNRK